MITLQRLLSSLVLGCLFVSLSSLAKVEYCPKAFDVLERVGSNSYQFVPKTLEKLFCTNKFEGEHFKIVLSTEGKAIPFDYEDKAIIRKAANVYHHLAIARDFWIETIGSDYVKKLPQIVVRLNITNAFSSTRHFMNAEQEKNYNNAWTIPEGESSSFSKEKFKWGKEIWFSPMKMIESREEIVSNGNNPIHEGLLVLEGPIVKYNQSRLIYDGIKFLFVPDIDRSALLESVIPKLGAIAIMYTLLYTTKYMDKFFLEKYYFLDTAMIPEVIYHEYSHIAMSDTMKTVHSVPVIEGMADYFAARISGMRDLYRPIKGFSNNQSKDLKNRSWYRPELELAENATSDFMVSLLWLAKEQFDSLNIARAKKGQGPIANFDELVHDAHFDLSETSNISFDLTGSLLKACRRKCSNPRAGLSLLHRVFEKKGMN